MAPMNIDVPRPTKEYHTFSYPAISPSRPELSLKGKTVLITGGATGIGLETSKAFAAAGAGTIAILARSEGPLTRAKESLETAFPDMKVLTFAASVTDSKQISRIVKGLEKIDILMLNAAAMHSLAPTLDIGMDKVEEAFSVNVVGPLSVIRAFMSLPHSGPRTIIYTATAINKMIPGASVYNASKIAMTSLMQCISDEYSEVGVRAFAFHPAVAWTPMAESLGLQADTLPYDSLDLPAHFAVWLSSAEADFLKGRFLWSHWDVDELKAKKDIILNDPAQLKVGLVQDKVVK